MTHAAEISSQLILVLGSVVITVVTVLSAFAGLLWFVAKLLLNPLKEDVKEIKKTLQGILPESEINNRTELRIGHHAQACRKENAIALEAQEARVRKHADDQLAVHVVTHHKV